MHPEPIGEAADRIRRLNDKAGKRRPLVQQLPLSPLKGFINWLGHQAGSFSFRTRLPISGLDRSESEHLCVLERPAGILGYQAAASSIATLQAGTTVRW